MARSAEVNKNVPNASGSVRPVPASSIAVQIAENHARAEAHEQPQSRAAFSQLLSELCEYPSAIDTDVQGNFKLISVLVKAGLGGAILGDRLIFQNPNDLSEVCACIDVIETVIERTPDVIVYHSPSSDDDDNADTCSLLLPKLFQLLIACKDESLTIRARKLLLHLLTVPNRSFKHRRILATVIKIYLTTIDGKPF